MPGLNYMAMFGAGSGIPYGSQGAGLRAPTASPGNIQGAAPTTGAGPYGAIPQVPSPITTQGTTIQGNIGNLGSLYNLGQGLNTQIAQQAALPYQLNLPNYGAMTGQSSQNILSLLQGQVPQDVANQLAQIASERGVATGSIGSPNANTALLRSLGLTSLGLTQQGESELTGAVGRTPTGQQFNPASFLVTPQQQQESQYLANLLAAAPDPTQAANAQLQNMLAGLGFGMLGGGGGYRQPSMPLMPMTTAGYNVPSAPSWAGLPALGSTPSIGGPQYGEPGSYYAPPPSYGAPQPGDLEAMGWGDVGGTDWQTGMPFDTGYTGEDFFSGDLFGGG